MDAGNRDTEILLQKLQALGGCDEASECSCTLHKMLLRTLADLKREREAEEQREANRQEEINNRKAERDIE
jgi:hypothetical protein